MKSKREIWWLEIGLALSLAIPLCFVSNPLFAIAGYILVIAGYIGSLFMFGKELETTWLPSMLLSILIAVLYPVYERSQKPRLQKAKSSVVIQHKTFAVEM